MSLVTEVPLVLILVCSLMVCVTGRYHLEELKEMMSHHQSPIHDNRYFESPTDENPSVLPLEDILLSMEHHRDTSDLKTANKRALSILTRWKSLGGVGRRTNALTKSPRAPMSLMQGDMDPGAKEMPGRRVGAPLRWGRRR